MSLEGATIANYHVHSKLWSSGAGVVYKARDAKLNRLVALKFLPAEMNKDAAAFERFVHEAEAASDLEHPNIATILEVAEMDGGQLVIVMEYYDGEPLSSKLVRRPGGKDPTSEAWGLHGVPRMEARPVASKEPVAVGSEAESTSQTSTAVQTMFEMDEEADEELAEHPITKVRLHTPSGDGGSALDAEEEDAEPEELQDEPVLPQDEYLDIIRQVGDGLSAAHAIGIFHRDIKPSDIIVTKEGQVVILDFGVASLKETLGKPGLRFASETVDYMAPEQVRGERTDHQTDLWSTGAILYEMVTGRRPFAGESTDETLEGILLHDPEDVQNDELRPVLQRALVKDKLERYSAAGDFVDDITRILEPPVEEPAAVVEQPEPAGLSTLLENRVYWAVAAAALVVLAVVLFAL